MNGGEVMNIQEFYDSIDESYENVSSRMMGNQKLVEKFVRKFLDDPTYGQIKEAVDMIRAGQREEVLPVIGEIEKEYQKVIEQIQKLD